MRFSLKSLSTARHSKTTRLQRGFTLIELVIVLAVLGALAAIAVPQLTGLQEEAELAGTATVIASEVSNAFAEDLADGEIDGDGESGVDWTSADCSSVQSAAPAFSSDLYSLETDNGDGVALTIPTYTSTNATVGSTTCYLKAN